MDPRDPQSLDNASRDFLDVLQADRRLAVARDRDREREQNRKRRIPQRGGEEPKHGPALVLNPAAPPPAQSEGGGGQGALVGGRAAGQQALVQHGAPGLHGQEGARPGPLAGGDPALVSHQATARTGIVGERPGRLPTGAPQQPPATGQPRAPMAGPPLAGPGFGGPMGGAPSMPSLAGGLGLIDGPPLAVVDARTLAALANAGTPQPGGRLVGPPAGAASATRGGSVPASGEPPLVGGAPRTGLGLGRAAAPPTLSNVTPAEVRDRIQLWMATGVLNTSPFRFAPIEPLAPPEPAASRMGTVRATPVSPLARSVGTKPTLPADLAPANDAPGPYDALAANDGLPSLGQAMFQDVVRRASAPAFDQPVRPPAAPIPSVAGPATPTPAAATRDQGAQPGTSASPVRAGKPLDFARAEAEDRARLGEDGPPSRLDVPGLTVPRL